MAQTACQVSVAHLHTVIQVPTDTDYRPPPTMAILPKWSSILSSSRSPWQRKNEASVHRTAKEFAVDRKCVHEWCQLATSHWKDKTAECLESSLRCAQPLSVNLDHWVSELVATDEIGSFYRSVIHCSLLCKHLGVALEEGAYSRDKMSDPTYKPPYAFY